MSVMAKRWMVRVMVGAALACSPSMARAAGPSPTRVSTSLRSEIAAARAKDVRPFVAVSTIVQNAPAADARARNHKAPLALSFARLGPAGVLPMVELVAFGAPTGVPAETWPRIRREMVEALGVLRDARALPTLLSVLEDAAEDEKTTRTAAEAVARFGTPEAEARLVRALDGAGAERSRAILAGMGECRTPRVVAALATRLAATKDGATARAAVKSLGRAGSAWAWQTEADKTRAVEVRDEAARALVDAFVRWDGEVRTAASNALMVVDAPSTPTRIADAKAAHPESAAALDALAARFAKNPTRTR